jgi:hypothetical protein
MAQNWFMRFSNAFSGWLLRTPLHGVLSGSTLLITFTTRKSGRTITTPVNYVRVGDDLLITSQRQRTWWRSLRSGNKVILRLQGRDVHAWAEAVEEPAAVAEGLGEYLGAMPGVAKYFNVRLDADGNPLAGDLIAAARERVVVRVNLKRAH